MTLLQLIEKTTLAQTEDQYPFVTVYDKEHNFYTFHQVSMPNPQWYKHFDTGVDVSESIGVMCQHKELLEYVTQEAQSLDSDACTEEKQSAVHIDSKER